MLPDPEDIKAGLENNRLATGTTAGQPHESASYVPSESFRESGYDEESEQVESREEGRSNALASSLRERGGRPVMPKDEACWLAEKPFLVEACPEGATEIEAILNLLNCLLGNSLLALPWAFAEAGMVLGSVLLMIGTILNRYTLLLLLHHVGNDGSGSYPQIGRWAFGWPGEMVVLGVYLMHSGGALCAYAVGLADIVEQQIQVFGFGEPARPLAALLAIILCAPGMMLGSLKRVAIFSALSMSAAMLFSIVLVSFTMGGAAPTGVQSSDLQWVRLDRLMAAWPIFGYVFAVQPGGVMVLSKFEVISGSRNAGTVPMEDETSYAQEEEIDFVQGVRWRVSAVAYIVAWLVGMLVGLFSYQHFGKDTRGNILETCYTHRTSLWSGSDTVLRVTSMIMLLSSCAFMVVPCRFALLEVLRLSGARGARGSSAEDVSIRLRRQISFGFLVLMMAIASLCDDISAVYRVVGAVATQVFALILPGVFTVKLAIGAGESWSTTSLRPLVVALFGVTALIFCIMHLVFDWIAQHSPIAPPQQ